MKKKHNYEYRKNRNTMLAYAVVAVYEYSILSYATFELFFGYENYDFKVMHLKMYPKYVDKCVKYAWFFTPA